MALSTCAWCELAPSEGSRRFCPECRAELMSWDAAALVNLLGMLQTLANLSKRVALFSREVAEDLTLGDRERLDQVRSLLCHWCAVRGRCGRIVNAEDRLFPGPICSNCGIPRVEDSGSGLCPGCHETTLRLPLSAIVRRVGSAAAEAVHWRAAISSARDVLAAALPCAAQIRALKQCLSEPGWTAARKAV